MQENNFLKIISIAADLITIIGLVWAGLYGFLKKHRNLIGFRINEFIISIFKIALIAIIGIILFHVFSGLFAFILVLTRGEFRGELWLNEYPISYLLSYFISGSIGIAVLWLASTIVWTGSLIYCKKIWGKKTKISTLEQSSLKSKKLNILKAEYKTENKSIDVTDKLKKMVKDNQLNIIASNDLAGDPDPGIVKVLKIDYQFGDGDIKKVTIPESELKIIKNG